MRRDDAGFGTLLCASRRECQSAGIPFADYDPVLNDAGVLYAHLWQFRTVPRPPSLDTLRADQSEEPVVPPPEFGAANAEYMAAYARLDPLQTRLHTVINRLVAFREAVVGTAVPGACLANAGLSAGEETVPTKTARTPDPGVPGIGPVAGGTPLPGAIPPAPPDGYGDLRRFARKDLKGKERAVVEAMCDSGGELPLADLAVRDGVGWEDAKKGFADAQRRLNPKLKSKRWRLVRHDNAARLVTTTPRKSR